MQANPAAWKTLRQRAGFGIVRLAEAADVYPSTIFRIEQGQTPRPQPATVRAVAEALAAELNTTVDQVFDQLVTREPEPVG
jgi:transcriptional regulator with XRE-family HTH domain